MFDAINVSTLEGALVDALSTSAPEVLVDLAALSFMDAAALSALFMGAVRSAQEGRKQRLIHVSPYYRHVLSSLDLDWLVTGKVPSFD